MSREIENSLKSPALDITELTSREQIQFHVTNMADQINSGRMAAAPQRNCTNLSDKIADTRIGTTVQGAGTLQVHVIDPWWKLLHRDAEGVCFIDATADGYLRPPIA